MSRYPLSADGAGEVQGQTSWGTHCVFDRLLCFVFLGVVPGAGWASSLLGAPVPQNDYSRARGGMNPSTPQCYLDFLLFLCPKFWGKYAFVMIKHALQVLAP